MYCKDREELDSSICRRFCTDLKKDSCIVGAAIGDWVEEGFTLPSSVAFIGGRGLVPLNEIESFLVGSGDLDALDSAETTVLGLTLVENVEVVDVA